MTKPTLTPEFKIEDLHKIRAWRYEKRKDMTPQEICEDTQRGASHFLTQLTVPANAEVLNEVHRRLLSARALQHNIA